MFNEKLIKEVVSGYSSPSQTGDVSKHLLEQGFFDKGKIPVGLKRDPQLSGGNSIDVLKNFEKQQLKIKGD